MKLMRIFSKETKRWLRALEIAKILFEDQVNHSVFLEEIENFIKREIKYSQKALNKSGEIESKETLLKDKELN